MTNKITELSNFELQQVAGGLTVIPKTKSAPIPRRFPIPFLPR